MASLAYKLAVPRVDEHVRREALLARISASWRRAAITWVVGLPGSGKTSAIARWVSDAPGPCWWYRLDESDADVASLFSSLASKSGRAVQLPVWSPENDADLPSFSRRFFAELSNEPLTLVLDDLHRVPDDAPLFEVLAQLHDVAGETLRVFAISRRPPPPVLARGVLGGWLALVDDLRLSTDEARDIAQALRGENLSPAETTALTRADGWLAHVLALSAPPRRAPVRRRRRGRLSRQ